uniref:G protein-coupled receptor 39 n=1 Tax=Eptatretus burgeri TaxID=7764 RepID=A0A8C4R501_EPTBU
MSRKMDCGGGLPFELSHAVKGVLTAVYVVLLTVGVLGNSITVYLALAVQGRKTCLQRAVRLHMLSLAISDLLVLIVGIPMDLSELVWYQFHGRDGMCKTYYFLWEICTYATLLNILTFSAERYLAICHPFRAKALSAARTRVMLCVVWLLAFFTGFPMLFGTGIENPLKSLYSDCPLLMNITICTSLSDKQGIYHALVFSCVITYIFVLIAVAVACILMIRTIMGLRSDSVNLDHHGAEQRCCMRKSKSNEMQMAKKQSVIMLSTVMGALALCWVPYQASRIMVVTRTRGTWTKEYFQEYETLNTVARTFFYLSSCINPVLYCLTSTRFRKGFIQVLCRCFCHEVDESKGDIAIHAVPRELSIFNRSREGAPHQSN